MSNSNQPQNPSVGNTLTGGIQDISAILPIIGTDQCERHVGSALSGGFFYAASAPLSIFGSLGIVKVAVGVLISSISIRKFWVSHHDLRPTGPQGKTNQSMFFGAKLLKNTGFELAGNVTPLIGMDGTRFKAETKLIQILEEKHIDNPEKVSIKWKSKQWNFMLVLFTIIAAAMSGVPYLALLLGPASWRPTTHLPWLFPFLRTVGSCLASVCCQLIIQSRVISSMKNRILFMRIHRRFVSALSKDNKGDLDAWLKYHLQWDSDLPAEQCIRNLEQALYSHHDIPEIGDDVQPTESHVSIDMPPEQAPATQWTHWRYRTSSTPQRHPLPPKPLFKTATTPILTYYGLRHLRDNFSLRDRLPNPILWVVLCLSLPATVAGYVGCFTLVGATPSHGNGPLFWLGLEAALSIIRILIWAWNPTFDEDTDLTVVLELEKERPFPVTEDVETFINHFEKEKTKPLVLLPERRFLEEITTYCGPLDQFRSTENIALYFTIMADNTMKEVGSGYLSLLITVFDFNTRIGVTFLRLGRLFYYFDADVKYEAAFSEINAIVHSTMRNIRPWRTQAGTLFISLEEYYTSLVRALNPTYNEDRNKIAKLERKWDLSPKPSKISTTNTSLPSSPDYELLSAEEIYEYILKTKLVGVWNRWIIENMKYIADNARCDSYDALADPTGKKARWRLTELDQFVAWEWTRRELALLLSSVKLEEVLRFKMEKYNPNIIGNQKGLRAKRMFGFEWDRLQRLDNEKREAKERMARAMREAGERARWEGRQLKPKWQECIDFIDTLWSEAIIRGPTALENAESEVHNLSQIKRSFDGHDTTKDDFIGQSKQRLAHWHSQRKNERHGMDATIGRIRGVIGRRNQLDSAYQYPEPDSQAASKFVNLQSSTSKGKACSAIAYDAYGCSAEAVCDVIKKSTTRSVINVDTGIVASIPPNDHLLFLSSRPEGEEPAFVQGNRNRWWNQQTTNSALFYFTPHGFGVSLDSCYVYSGPIAHIFMFLKTPSRVRLRLLHTRRGNIRLSIYQKGKSICTLSDTIPCDNYKLQALELEELGPGRHELQVVGIRVPETQTYGYYYLRDILIDFLDDPAQKSSSSEDMDQNNEIRSTIGAVYDAEEELSNSLESPLPLRDKQDSGLEDHTDTQILNEDREAGPDVHVQILG